MRNIALFLSYLGTAFHGWQMQKNPGELWLICTFTKQILQQASSVCRTEYLPVLMAEVAIPHLYTMMVG